MLNKAVIEQFLKDKLFPLSFKKIFPYDYNFPPDYWDANFLIFHHISGNNFC